MVSSSFKKPLIKSLEFCFWDNKDLFIVWTKESRERWLWQSIEKVGQQELKRSERIFMIMFLCGKTKISEKDKMFSLETQPRKFILCIAFLRNRKMRLSRAEWSLTTSESGKFSSLCRIEMKLCFTGCTFSQKILYISEWILDCWWIISMKWPQ